ncbi:ABC transporter ATP-binding protein [Acidipropionibacterium acidipropionici]|uniref:ABC transporter ATP-binding protein n=1 Tax=Acidipropionibacterium acidipropionici TaxID=1748 RepID=UPI00110B15AA|nr:ATP-binding cassette domain-containing protein [Acidipropionibacterium acidipropionici]QCV95900.1 ATP-binding cassette domain-containing protein [Acidipropionibacterium acidipropionici]
MAPESPAGSALVAAGVSAGYEGEKVLDGVDLTVGSGDSPLGLVGPSGVGKTTLIRVLKGTVLPWSGSVTFNGTPVHKLRFGAAKVFTAGARFMSQDSMTIVDPRETVKDRLKLASKEARKGGRPHDVTPVQMLASVGLGEEYLGRAMRTLSGGEQQRVALATALATRPEILVLDEPLSAVDPGSRAQIARMLAAMIAQLEIGTMVASHDLDLIQHLCPEVAFLADGRIVARGPLREVLDSGEHPAIRDMADNAREALVFRR